MSSPCENCGSDLRMCIQCNYYNCTGVSGEKQDKDRYISVRDAKEQMVAMLTELQLEIEELWDNRYDVWLDNQYYIGKNDTLEEVDEVIQQKINALKAKTEANHVD